VNNRVISSSGAWGRLAPIRASRVNEALAGFPLKLSGKSLGNHFWRDGLSCYSCDVWKNL